MWPLLLIFGIAWLVSSMEDRERERRRLEAPREPRELKPVRVLGPTPEEKKDAALKARLQSLRAQHEPFSHYNDPKWLTKHAKGRLQWLLDNRDDILANCKELHETHLDPAYDEDLSYVYEHDCELSNSRSWFVNLLYDPRSLSIKKHLTSSRSSCGH